MHASAVLAQSASRALCGAGRKAEPALLCGHGSLARAVPFFPEVPQGGIPGSHRCSPKRGLPPAVAISEGDMATQADVLGSDRVHWMLRVRASQKAVGMGRAVLLQAEVLGACRWPSTHSHLSRGWQSCGTRGMAPLWAASPLTAWKGMRPPWGPPGAVCQVSTGRPATLGSWADVLWSPTVFQRLTLDSLL